MNEALVAQLTEIKNNAAQFDSEEATKQWAILPVLECVGWNIRAIGEVVPEYPVGGGKVDYCLKHSGREQCFVEAKNSDRDLQGSQEQLLRYVFQAKADIAVLTNGVTWWFYLPHEGGSWEEKKFFVVDLGNQEPSVAAEHLEQFLGKNWLVSGEAVKRAKELLKGRERERAIEQSLPKAWEQLLRQSEESLCRPIADQTEKICGHRPGTDEVVAFLRRLPDPSLGGAIGPDRTNIGVRSKDYSAQPTLPRGTRPGQHPKPDHFVFRGQTYGVRSWSDVLTELMKLLYDLHPATFFSKVQPISGNKWTYFSRRKQGMQQPRQIGDSGIYVETHFSRQRVIGICQRVLKELGYRDDDFRVFSR